MEAMIISRSRQEIIQTFVEAKNMSKFVIVKQSIIRHQRSKEKRKKRDWIINLITYEPSEKERSSGCAAGHELFRIKMSFRHLLSFVRQTSTTSGTINLNDT